MKIQIVYNDFAVCKLNEIPYELLKNDFCFLSKTDEEISIVCPVELIPKNAVEVSKDWKCFRVCGVLDFSLIGILAEISNLLANNKISLFAISTYNTDYILIKSNQFDSAIKLLLDNGYIINK